MKQRCSTSVDNIWATNYCRYSKEKKRTVLLLIEVLFWVLPKEFFIKLPQQYHRVVTVTHNATLQCILNQLKRCFHVLLRDVFIRRGYCSP